MADVTIHVDRYQDEQQRQRLLRRLHSQTGVQEVTAQDNHPGLLVVKYNPQQVTSQTLLGALQAEGLKGELIGL